MDQMLWQNYDCNTATHWKAADSVWCCTLQATYVPHNTMFELATMIKVTSYQPGCGVWEDVPLL